MGGVLPGEVQSEAAALAEVRVLGTSCRRIRADDGGEGPQRALDGALVGAERPSGCSERGVRVADGDLRAVAGLGVVANRAEGGEGGTQEVRVRV